MKQISLMVACGAMLALSSCTVMQQRNQTEQAPAPEPVAEGDGGGTATAQEEAVVPTEAQQASAIQLLESRVEEAPEAAPGVPGRGIRMGVIAPPEEAASTTEGNAPRPNTVDRHGLRSLQLPTGLPMDMNGKVNPQSDR